MEISQGMKIHHQFGRGLIWDHEPPSLTLGCKRFRPLAPKFATTTTTTTTIAATFDLKSFIRPESTGSRKIGSSDYQKKESTQVQVDQAAAQPAAAGGTRWNPTQEQIGILEMLYRSGMRTPNAQQIEQITVQLAKYGKIEGKNVFYWFQNHKARERQKQKRNNNTSTTLGFIHSSPRTPPSPLSTLTSLILSPTKGNGVEEDQNSPCKRKCRSWAIDECSEEDRNISYCTEEEEEEVGKDRTLKLFPLHPEGRS